MKKTIRFAVLVVVGFLLVGSLAAQYPQKPLNYIIPFNPGGESDIFARAQQPLLEKILRSESHNLLQNRRWRSNRMGRTYKDKT